MSLPSATITIAYDADPAGAADALLAVIKLPRTSANPENDVITPTPIRATRDRCDDRNADRLPDSSASAA